MNEEQSNSSCASWIIHESMRLCMVIYKGTRVDTLKQLKVTYFYVSCYATCSDRHNYMT